MRAAKPIPPQGYLRELFDYDSCTGVLFWRTRDISHFPNNRSRSQEILWRVWNGKNAGKEAFTCVNSAGYREGTIDGEKFLAHRVIYKWVHGTEPAVVDHDNRDTVDNRSENLVDGSQKENMRNRKLSSNNSSGHNGVYFVPATQKWVARITVDGEYLHLGTYPTIEQAIAARDAADKQHNFHQNHGK